MGMQKTRQIHLFHQKKQNLFLCSNTRSKNLQPIFKTKFILPKNIVLRVARGHIKITKAVYRFPSQLAMQQALSDRNLHKLQKKFTMQKLNMRRLQKKLEAAEQRNKDLQKQLKYLRSLQRQTEYSQKLENITQNMQKQIQEQQQSKSQLIDKVDTLARLILNSKRSKPVFLLKGDKTRINEDGILTTKGTWIFREQSSVIEIDQRLTPSQIFGNVQNKLPTSISQNSTHYFGIYLKDHRQPNIKKHPWQCRTVYLGKNLQNSLSLFTPFYDQEKQEIVPVVLSEGQWSLAIAIVAITHFEEGMWGDLKLVQDFLPSDK